MCRDGTVAAATTAAANAQVSLVLVSEGGATVLWLAANLFGSSLGIPL